jgi:hypothetical protein
VTVHAPLRIGTDLRHTPLQAHHEAGDTSGAQKPPNIVDLSKNMACGVLLGKARWVLVRKDAKQEAHKVPHSNKETIISPTTLFGDHLSIEHRRAEGEDSEDHEADVFATFLDGNNFTRSSERNKLVEAGTDPRENVSSWPWLVMVLI